MGVMVDTNVWIRLEKEGDDVDLSGWSSAEPVRVSPVIVSELLVGVHRANTEERRLRRLQFVEAVIARILSLDFDVAVARIHSEICAELASKGQPIGAHDLIIAATAKRHQLSVLTENVAEFSRVPGLNVISFVKSK